MAADSHIGFNEVIAMNISGNIGHSNYHDTSLCGLKPNATIFLSFNIHISSIICHKTVMIQYLQMI